MNAVQVKVCGINSLTALNAALAARADYIGLVFFAASPRDVSLELAAALSTAARGAARVVGLFVDPDPAFVAAVHSAVMLDVIQLHGAETPAQAALLRQATQLEVWKAVGVCTAADVAAAAYYVGAADRILYDAKPPEGAPLPGGTGLRIDWSLLAGAQHPLPWMLAGGLDPGNVATAIAVSGAVAVDVSSGVESAPGVKDVDKIAAFCKAARL